MDRKIVIGHLFKEQLNAYGDGGNVDVLKARLKERKISAEIIEYAINENIDFDELDLI
jgi:CobQ-like glutamine amidotransferase family enzyme